MTRKEVLHRACAVYAHCMREFTSRHPKAFVDAEAPLLLRANPGQNTRTYLSLFAATFFTAFSNGLQMLRFLAKHADSDCLNLVHESVPPGDLTRIGIFRAALGKYEKQVGSLLKSARVSMLMYLQLHMPPAGSGRKTSRRREVACREALNS